MTDEPEAGRGRRVPAPPPRQASRPPEPRPRTQVPTMRPETRRESQFEPPPRLIRPSEHLAMVERSKERRPVPLTPSVTVVHGPRPMLPPPPPAHRSVAPPPMRMPGPNRAVRMPPPRTEIQMSLSDISLSGSSDEEFHQTRRTFKKRMNPYEYYSEEEFKSRYRMSKATIMFLVSKIETKIKPVTFRNKSISALEQVLLTISFYATGAFQITVADHVRVHKSTACRIIKKVSAAIAELRPQFITMPRTEEECNLIKSGFYSISSFPNVIGTVDCTHIKIQSPGGSQAELYRNRKGYFSLNIQVICDSKLTIMDVICRWPGSAHDTTIINDSHIRADFESGVYGSDYLLGDSGYPCRSYLLTPFLHPSTPCEEAYNQSHIRTRNTVERCFGVLKRRFPCLSMGLRVNIETTMNIVVACCILHNLALSHNDPIDDDLPDIEHDIPEISSASLVTNGNTSVRSALVLTHFNQ